MGFNSAFKVLKYRMSLTEGPVVHGRMSECVLEKQVVSASIEWATQPV